MKNIIQIIKDAGLEITDEQKKTIEDAVKENYKSVSDYDKQTRKVETLTQERDKFKTQYETAKETLDGFEGKTSMRSQENVMSGRRKLRMRKKNGKTSLKPVKKSTTRRLKKETSTMF